MGIYPNLRAEMARHGKSANDLASTCECSVSRIYRCLQGNSEFSVTDCQRILQVFPNTTFEYLFE